MLLKLSQLRGWRPKSARASPNNVLSVFQTSSEWAHFRRSYRGPSRTREQRQIAPAEVHLPAE